MHRFVHGKLYTVDVAFPKLQVEGACNIKGKVEEFTFHENCSFVETFCKWFERLLSTELLCSDELGYSLDEPFWF